MTVTITEMPEFLRITANFVPSPDSIVEQLKAEIVTIRKSCQHNFQLYLGVILYQLNIDGIFQVSHACHIPDKDLGLVLQCTICGETSSALAKNMCPCCLQKIEPSKDQENREKYFGRNLGRYVAARTGQCVGCGLKVVWDELNQ